MSAPVEVAPNMSGGSGSDEHRLARGSVAQQVAMTVSVFTTLGVITLLARTLTLGEFAVYGLLVSIPTYLLFAQANVETAAIRAMATARDRRERDRAITTALAVYTVAGLLAGALIVFGGDALLGVFAIAEHLRTEARLGLLAIGAINVAGWPAKAAQDALRGSGLFVVSSAAECAAFLTFGALVAIAVALSARLWVLAGIGGAVPLLVGLWSTCALLLVRLPLRPRPSALSLSYTRSFLSLSSLLLVTGIADLVIYSADRTILAAFRPVSTVALYEGPVRAHNLLRQLQATMLLIVMPAASLYAARGDAWRLRELLMRGTRYVAIVMTPLTVTLMTLAAPILRVWLGQRFVLSADSMTIFVSYWLVASCPSVGLAMLIAVGRVRAVAVYACVLAALNLAISLALTPKLGLEGIVLGTTLSYLIMLPVFLLVVCRAFEVTATQMLREGYGTALGAGALLAAFELLARAVLPIDSAVELLATIALGLGAYGAIAWRIGLQPRERMLVREVLAHMARPGAS